MTISRVPHRVAADVIGQLTAADIEAWLRALPPGTVVGRCGYAISCLIAEYVRASTGLSIWVNPHWGDGQAGVPGSDPGTRLRPDVAEIGRAFDRIDRTGRGVSARRALRRLFDEEATP